MEIIIFRTAAILGFRRLQSYMLPCLYALLVPLTSKFITARSWLAVALHVLVSVYSTQCERAGKLWVA